MPHVLDARRPDGRPMRIMYDTVIDSCCRLDTTDTKSLPIIVPGIIDLQVNGFAGVDFNDPAVTSGMFDQACEALKTQGVTRFCVTLITDDLDRLQTQLRRLESFRTHGNAAARPHYDYHLEGPYISLQDGPRGAHPLGHVHEPSVREVADFLDKAGEIAERIKIVTLSPEYAAANGVITYLTHRGILAAIGHTAATAKQIQNAVDAGARMATHLGNGCAALLPRHDNPIMAVLAEERLAISVIADGFHLPPELLKVFYKVKHDRIVLVSDATRFAGMPPGHYEAPIGGRVVLTPEGRLHVADSPHLLAGSARSAFDGFRHLHSLGLDTPERLWRLVSEHPASLLGLSSPPLSPGRNADFLLIDDTHGDWRITATCVGGQCFRIRS